MREWDFFFQNTIAGNYLNNMKNIYFMFCLKLF